MPRAGHNLLGSLSRQLVIAATFRPLLTVGLGLFVAAVAIYSGVNFIQVHTSRADLLNPKNDYHRRWLAYVREFSEQEDVYVVVEGPHPAAIRPALEELAEAFRRQPRYFESILERVDRTQLKKKGLYYLAPEQLQQILSGVQQLKGRLAQLGPALQPAQICLEAAVAVTNLPPGQLPPQAVGQITQVVQCLAMCLSGNPDQLAQQILTQIASHNLSFAPASGAMGDAGPTSDPPRDAAPDLPTDAGEAMFFSSDGKLGLVTLRFTPDQSGQFTRFAAHIRKLREITEEVNERYPNLKIGSTGLPILEYDEMKASSSSAGVALLSLAGVILVFFAGFGGVRYPGAVTLSLVMGVSWAIGYVVIAVGHLNILTSAFGAMLIGLGDYGVHFVAHYLEKKRSQPKVREALIKTAETVGPSITTGAVTTAVAFFAGALTDFLGVAELGIIAGGGILLCWLADMTVLPAFLCLIERDGLRSERTGLLELTPWFRPLAFCPKTITIAVGAVIALLAMGIPYLRYDYNLLHLQPKGLESVENQNKLVEHMSRSSYFALSLAKDTAEAKRRKAEFLKLPSVDHVEELVSILPDNVEEKQAIIEQLAAELADWSRLNTNIPQPEILDQALLRLQMALQQQQSLPSSAQTQWLIEHIRRALRNLTPNEYYARLSYLPQTVQDKALTSLASLTYLTENPAPPTLNDLPQPLVERFVGKHGKHLLQVYCKGDFWEPVTMRQFVADVRSVDPEATGNPIQIYEACHQMNRAYIEAALYALMAILITLYLDFRSLKDVLLSLIPLLLGMLGLFGLMGWLDIPLNPANMITLPLILGIGIDDGVHILHDFRRQGRRYRMPENATLTAVMINSLTTLVGFGALMASPHCGLESLGRVLTFGMAFCLAIAVLMPGFLRWISGQLSTTQETEATSWETDLQKILNEVATGDDLSRDISKEKPLLASNTAQATHGESKHSPPEDLPIHPISPRIRPRKAA